MVALLPVSAAADLTRGISEYLTTSFSLTDAAVSDDLAGFLTSPETGMFRGPYVRTRLPYAPADSNASVLGWSPEWFTPYQHQADAFERLASSISGVERRPQPTLVVTGTGSGKTESFLYPIIDHCARIDGRRRGIKALLLYPMNALANDQATRLAKLLHDDPALSNVTAGKFTGESGNRKRMTEDGLIEDRDTLRDNPPDILITNYKMLDQLLMRPSDRRLWSLSAETLQYLVLDEFHTYDGAQGTDVALLLRRLGLVLQSHATDPARVAAFASQPLGPITPVATSATLGSKEDPSRILRFAETIFGEALSDDAVVSESLLSLSEWQAEMRARFGAASAGAVVDAALVESVCAAVPVETANHHLDVHSALSSQVFLCSEDLDSALAAAAAHPIVASLLGASSSAVSLEELANAVLSEHIRRVVGPLALEFVTHLLTELAWLRAQLGEREGFRGKIFPGVETHLWVREISRIDRAVGGTVGETSRFSWYDDGTRTYDDGATALPAIYCRNCGRSGWMTAIEPGTDTPELDSRTIRTASISRENTVRPLIDATSEFSAAESTGQELAAMRSLDSGSAVRWLHAGNRTLSSLRPVDEDIDSNMAVPVLTIAGENVEDLARTETCPSCGEHDSIRYLGSSVATLLSVALSNLFGMDDLDTQDKKTLVFTDSVQDAAHRAGFVQSRSRAFSLRTHAHRALTELGKPSSIDELVASMLKAARTPEDRYGLLPPEVTGWDAFRGYWDPNASKEAKHAARASVKNRLLMDLGLEFGDRADLTRSLALTGAATVRVAVADFELIDAAVSARGAAGGAVALDETPELLGAWARGIVEQIRMLGGVYHDWFHDYLVSEGNTYMLNRRDKRFMGMPRFAKGGAPEFPWLPGRGASGRAPNNEGIYNVASERGRYAKWTSRVLGVNRHDAARLVAELLKSLKSKRVLRAEMTGSAMVLSVPSTSVVASIEDEPQVLECTICHQRTGVARGVREALTGKACFTPGCEGSLQVVGLADNYYRRMYSNAHPRTIVAREHTGMIPQAERLETETLFKTDQHAPDKPNVLVATPTLEMGIDIGDLSTVMLASLPNTVSSYVQRVGRAGRLTGNSLIVALDRGRGATLPKFNDPLSIISGAVTPPTAFLSATDILHRQFIAHLIDTHDVDPSVQYGSDCFDTQNGLVYQLAKRVEAGVDPSMFLSALAGQITDQDADGLRAWVASMDDDGLRSTLLRAREQWRNDRFTLLERRKTLDELIDRLTPLVDSDDLAREEHRRAKAARTALNKRLNDEVEREHWIASLERYSLAPNFTLIDDSVQLSLSVTRQNAETAEFDVERREYVRGLSSALSELAPGSTFYAQGIAATIDAVDIRGSEEREQWRVCPSCSYGSPVGPDDHTATCPACGDPGFADAGQLIEVIPMRRVSASVDASRAAINDFRDERAVTRFHQHMVMSVDKPEAGAQWYISCGFGAHYLPRVDLRWLNLGRGEGKPLMLAGDEVQAPKFSLCKECGHVDSTRDENSPLDHQPWCSLRTAAEEDTMTVSLGRTLRTQGVVLYIPAVLTAGDNQAMPSILAAIRLGFKEALGGDPTHLAISPVRVPMGDGSVDAVLLHDNVPGGTGYLTQFSSPEKVRLLLERAWEKVSTCACADTDQLACPQCLLPFAPAYQVESTSRATAQRILRAILSDDLHPTPDNNPLERAWETTEHAPEMSTESKLEARFRKMFRAALEDRHVKFKVNSDSAHTSWDFSFESQPNRSWKLIAQDDSDKVTIPDFVLTPSDRTLSEIAIYLDGYAYHGTGTSLNGDLDKRRYLRDRGKVVWSLTWEDLDRFEQNSVKPAGWYNAVVASNAASGYAQFVSTTDLEVLKYSALQQLLEYVEHPESQKWFYIGLTALAMAKETGTIDVVPGNGSYQVDFDASAHGQRLEKTLWSSLLNADNLVALIKSEKPDSEPEKKEAAVEKVSDAWNELITDFPEYKAVLESLARAGAPDDFDDEEIDGMLPVVAWPSRKVAIMEDDQGLDAARTEGWTAWLIEDLDPAHLPDELLIHQE